MSRIYLHSPNAPSWRGAWLSTGTPLPFTYLENISKLWGESYFVPCRYTTPYGTQMDLYYFLKWLIIQKMDTQKNVDIIGIYNVHLNRYLIPCAKVKLSLS
jgi:hypothetical protein